MAKTDDDYDLIDYADVPNGLILKELKRIRLTLSAMNEFLRSDGGNGKDGIDEPVPKKAKSEKVIVQSERKPEVETKKDKFEPAASDDLTYEKFLEFKAAANTLAANTSAPSSVKKEAPEKRFKCRLCGRFYAQRAGVKKHLLDLHKVPPKDDKDYYVGFIEKL